MNHKYIFLRKDSHYNDHNPLLLVEITQKSIKELSNGIKEKEDLEGMKHMNQLRKERALE